MARVTLLLLCISYAMFAAALRPPYMFDGLVDAFPALWRWVFGAASLGCLGVAIAPQAFSLRIASLVLVTVAAGSRMLALMFLSPGTWAPPVVWQWLIIVVLQLYVWPTLLNHARSRKRHPWSYPWR